MSITFINPERKDIDAQLTFLKPAFNGVENIKAEYEDCCDAVKSKRAGLYRLKGDDFNVRFVGVAVDDGYQLWALTGFGYLKAVEHILAIVENQGYQFIRCHTVRPGITRMLQRFGVRVSEQQCETVLTLYFKDQ